MLKLFKIEKQALKIKIELKFGAKNFFQNQDKRSSSGRCDWRPRGASRGLGH